MFLFHKISFSKRYGIDMTSQEGTNNLSGECGAPMGAALFNQMVLSGLYVLETFIGK
jgi:hypothetical protein